MPPKPRGLEKPSPTADDKKTGVPAVKYFGAGDLDALRPGKLNSLPPSRILTRPTLPPKRSSFQGTNVGTAPQTTSGGTSTAKPEKKLSPLKRIKPAGVDYDDIPIRHQAMNAAGGSRQRVKVQALPPAPKGSGRVFIQGRSGGGVPQFELPDMALPPTPARKNTPLAELPPTPSPVKAPSGRRRSSMKPAKQAIASKTVLPNLNPYERAIMGYIDGLPAQRSSVIRVFLSSTFSDFKMERNALAKKSYPELRSFCADLGLDFQVVDLRWGISEDSSNDHTVEDICLLEIEHCQRLSRGTTFMAMTGHRYGYRPIPPKIESEEFEKLRKIADELGLNDRQVLDEWYLKDENAMPNVHVLQAISSKLPDYVDNSPEKAEDRKVAMKSWDETFGKMQKVLRESATEANKRNDLSAERMHEYFTSVTEQEISKGILDSETSDSTAFYIKRTFTDTEKMLDSKVGHRFIDCNHNPDGGTPSVDTDTADLIKNLAKNKISAKLGLANMHAFSTTWCDTGIDPTDADHDQYLTKLCVSFTETVKRQVEECREKDKKEQDREANVIFNLEAKRVQSDDVKAPPPPPPGKRSVKGTTPFQNGAINESDLFLGRMAMETIVSDLKDAERSGDAETVANPVRVALSTEVLHHLHFCKSKCDVFCGRDDEMRQLKDKVLKTEAGKTIVVHGESGHGKTAFVAAVARESKAWLKKCVTVVRFLGTSPKSSTIKGVLTSVCNQICVAYGQPINNSNYTKMVKLKKYFIDLIHYVSIKYGESRPLVILLDSLDQLIDNNGAHACDWIPRSLPKHVTLLLSTLPDQHGILKSIRKKSEGKEICLFELSKFPADIAEVYARAYTDANKVALREEQMRFLVEKLSANTQPLLMKLILDSACRWRSYTRVSEVQLARTTEEAITEMFAQLERKYCPAFIRGCMAYLTLGLNGLSEIELEDVLSCDDEILAEVYKYHNPPVDGTIRIPELLWARVHHDLRDYIVERQTHGKTTLNWYHRQFIEAATRRYVSDDAVFKARHKRLAEIYLVEDALCRTIHLPQRSLTIENADRQVTPQPSSTTNTRKLTSLPYHLRCAGDEETLKEKVFCNMDFIAHYISNFSVNDMIEEMADSADEDVEMVKNCLRFTSVHNQTKLDYLATQIIGQLVDKAPESPMIQQLVGQAREMLIQGGKKAALIPISGGIAPPTSLLKWYQNGVADMVTKSEDGATILLKSENEKKGIAFSLLNTEKLSLKPIYSKTRLAPHHCVFSRSGRRLYILCKKSFYVVAVKSGEILVSQNTDTNHKEELSDCIAVTSTESHVALAGRDRLVMLEDRMASGEPFRSRAAMNLSGCVGTANFVFTADDAHTISTHAIKGKKREIGCIVLWGIAENQLKSRIALPAPVERGFLYELSPLAGPDLVLCGCDNAQIFLVNVQAGEIVTDLFRELSIQAPVLSAYHKQSSALVTCIRGQQEVKVWDVSTGTVKDVATFDTRSPVTTVAISSDSNTIITADEGGTLKLFDITARKLKNIVKSHHGTLSKIICTDKDTVFTCATDKVLKNWDLEELLTKSEMGKETETKKRDEVKNLSDVQSTHFAVSPDGKYIASGSSDSIDVWAIADSHLTCVTRIPHEACADLFFTPDSAHVVALSLTSQRLGTWMIATGEESGIANIVAADDKFLSACSLDGGKRLAAVKKGPPNTLVIVDMDEREATGSVSLAGVTRFNPCCGYNTGESQFIIGYSDKITTASGLGTHDVISIDARAEGGKAVFCKQNDKSVAQAGARNMHAFTVHPGEPGAGVMIGGYGDLYLWNPAEDMVHDMKKATAGCWPEKSLHHHLKHAFKIPVDELLTLPITMVTAMAGHEVVVTGCQTGALVAWRASTDPAVKEATVITMKGHSNAVTSGAFSEGGEYLITGSQDRTVRVWDVSTGKQLCHMYVHMGVDKVSFVPGNRYAVALVSDVDRNKLLCFELSVNQS